VFVRGEGDGLDEECREKTGRGNLKRFQGSKKNNLDLKAREKEGRELTIRWRRKVADFVRGYALKKKGPGPGTGVRRETCGGITGKGCPRDEWK